MVKAKGRRDAAFFVTLVIRCFLYDFCDCWTSGKVAIWQFDVMHQWGNGWFTLSIEVLTIQKRSIYINVHRSCSGKNMKSERMKSDRNQPTKKTKPLVS
jgi:hypothetical protein